MRIYMQLSATNDQSPRFYQLLVQQDLLEGWSLVREWGRQGSPGRIKRDHFPTREAAIEACISVRDSQLKRGYRVVYSQGQGPTP